MPKQPDEADLREIPKRPFGVYVVVFLLLLGMLEAVLEIFRIQYSLTGIWAETEEFFRRRSGIVTLVIRVFQDPTIVTIANGIIVVIWFAIILGLWLLQRWAWVLMMILIGVTLTYSLVMYVEGTPDYLGMVVYVAIVFYLNDHSVQRAFARRRNEAAE